MDLRQGAFQPYYAPPANGQQGGLGVHLGQTGVMELVDRELALHLSLTHLAHMSHHTTPLTVSPDDQRFVMLEVSADVDTEILIIENFFEEPKAPVGN